MTNYIVFCDFDGTISLEDTVDRFLETFADEKWLYFEELWKKGYIGSRECLYQQINCVNKISETVLHGFIRDIQIDPDFYPFLELLNNCNIEFNIVSDGFKFFITRILERYFCKVNSIFSNDLNYDRGKLQAIFPYHKENCDAQSGMCKCNIILQKNSNQKIIYIGDGRSDFCAVKHADIIFAKKSLATYCKTNEISYIPYNNFSEVIHWLTKEIDYNDKYTIKSRRNDLRA